MAFARSLVHLEILIVLTQEFWILCTLRIGIHWSLCATRYGCTCNAHVVSILIISNRKNNSVEYIVIPSTNHHIWIEKYFCTFGQMKDYITTRCSIMLRLTLLRTQRLNRAKYPQRYFDPVFLHLPKSL